jgi:hypothetical protein
MASHGGSRHSDNSAFADRLLMPSRVRISSWLLIICGRGPQIRQAPAPAEFGRNGIPMEFHEVALDPPFDIFGLMTRKAAASIASANGRCLLSSYRSMSSFRIFATCQATCMKSGNRTIVQCACPRTQ